jgi:hypothetical protein
MIDSSRKKCLKKVIGFSCSILDTKIPMVNSALARWDHMKLYISVTRLNDTRKPDSC